MTGPPACRSGRDSQGVPRCLRCGRPRSTTACQQPSTWGQLWTVDEEDGRFTLFACFVSWPDNRDESPTCFGRLYLDRTDGGPPVAVLTELDLRHDNHPELNPDVFTTAATALMNRTDGGRWNPQLNAMAPPRPVRQHVDPRDVAWFAELAANRPGQPRRHPSVAGTSTFVEVALNWDNYNNYTLAADGWQPLKYPNDPDRLHNIELYTIDELCRDM